MVQRTIIALLLCFLVVNCAEKTALSFQQQTFSEQELAECETTACPEIRLNYLEAKGSEPFATVINDSVYQFLIRVLHIGDPDQPITATTVSEASKEFINTYRMHLAEFPDMPAAYEVEATVSESFQDEQYLSLETTQYTYTGGAHGYGSTSFLLFDRETETALRFKDVISDWEAFQQYVETEFRKQYEIPLQGAINANGFWFENDTFYISESIGLTEEGILMIYNPYEIASYAEGAITLELPWKDIQPYISRPSL